LGIGEKSRLIARFSLVGFFLDPLDSVKGREMGNPKSEIPEAEA
jgi:hypothetical protein